MNFCSNCGNKIEDEANFCGSCGYKIGGQANKKSSKSIVNRLNKADKEYEVASRGKRFLNLIIDGFSIMFVSIFIGFVFGLFGLIGENTDDSVFTILYYLGYLCYYIGMESIWGKTVGKMLTGTKVISVNVDEPTLSQIIKRTLIRLIPFEAFSFTGFIHAAGERPIGWHDSWSKTRVIVD